MIRDLKLVIIFFLVTFMLSSCAVVGGFKPKNSIDIVIDSKLLNSISKKTEVVVTVYGWDKSIADAPASILKTETFAANKIPLVFKFYVDESLRGFIKPSSGDSKRYGYYLGLNFENSDLSVDFDNTNEGKGPLFVNKLSSLSQTIYIK